MSGQQKQCRERCKRGQGLSQGSLSAAAMLARELGMGVHGVIDVDKGVASGKGLENKKEKGETPPNTQGLKTSKSPRLVGIQHQGGPQKAEGAAGALGEGRGAKGRPPSPCRPALLPSSLLAAQSLLRLQLSSPRGEVLVASKHLNIA